MAATFLLASQTQLASAEMASAGPAKITGGNQTSIPDGFREWVFLGAPLTPNGLNGGEAGFPEFHHVYVEPSAFAYYQRTGEFPAGTTIVKELVLLKEADYEDGSREEPSGRGYFAKSFAGIDMMVKNTELFADTNGWGFFKFGHHAPPYAETRRLRPMMPVRSAIPRMQPTTWCLRPSTRSWNGRSSKDIVTASRMSHEQSRTGCLPETS